MAPPLPTGPGPGLSEQLSEHCSFLVAGPRLVPWPRVARVVRVENDTC